MSSLVKERFEYGKYFNLELIRMLAFCIASGSLLLVSYYSSVYFESFGFIPVFIFVYFLVFILGDLKSILYAAWFLMPFELYLTVTATTHILPVEIINITIFVFIFVKVLIEKGKYKMTGYEKLLGLYLFFAVLGLLKSPVKTTSLGVFISIINGYALFFAITQYAEKKDLKKFIYIFIFLGLLESILMLLQITTGKFGYIPREGKRGVIESLFQSGVAIVTLGNGTFRHFNAVGSFIDIIYPFFLAFLYLSKRKIIWFIGLIIMIMGIVITHSRGTLLATLVSSILFLIIVSKNKFLKVFFPISVGFISLVMAGIIWRMGYAVAIVPSLFGRLALWNAGFIAFKQNFLIGGGIGSSVFYTTRYYGLASKYHSLYVTLLAERGIIGFTIFMSILFVFIRKNFRSLRRLNKFKERNILMKGIVIGSLCSFAGFLAHELVDHAYVNPVFKFWFYGFLGFSYHVSRYTKKLTGSADKQEQ